MDSLTGGDAGVGSGGGDAGREPENGSEAVERSGGGNVDVVHERGGGDINGDGDGDDGARNDGTDAEDDYPSAEEWVHLDETVMKQLRRGDPNVRHLRVTFDTQEREGFDADRVDWESQGKAFAKSTRLKSLYFDSSYHGTHNGHHKWANFQQFLATVARNKSIKHLFLGRSMIWHSDLSSVLSLLGLFLENNPSLRSVEIGDDGWGRDIPRGHDMNSMAMSSLAWVLEKNRTITRFVMLRESHGQFTKQIDAKEWVSLSRALSGLSSSLTELNLSHNRICGEGANAIAESIGTMMTTLKTLNLADALPYLDGRGWRTFFSRLRHFHSLEYLCLDDNNLDDEDIAAMVDALGSICSLRRLSLCENSDVSEQGWQAVASILELPRCQLKELVLRCYNARAFRAEIPEWSNQIDDDVIIAIAHALADNKSLRELQVGRRNPSVTERGWTALANVLCNNSSIETILASNHTLQRINWSGLSGYITTGEEIFCRSWDLPFDEEKQSDDKKFLVSCLRLNEGANKFEVVRKKIILYHFSNGEENIQDIRDLELPLIPRAMAWIGRDDSDLSLLYRFVQSAPSLFEMNGKAAVGGKRKRRN